MIKRLNVLLLGIIWVLSSDLVASAQGDPVITPENAAQVTQLALWGHGTINDLDWSPDGTTLAVSGSVGIWLYDTQNWQAEPRLIASPSRVWQAAFSPDGQTLATVGEEGKVTVWDMITGAEIRTLKKQTSIINVAYSPDGVTLALALEDGVIELWNTTTWAAITTFNGNEQAMLTVAFSPDGTKLVAGDNRGLIWVWDIPSDQLYATLEGHENQVWSVAFSPDGQEIASWSNDYSVRLWDVATKQESTNFHLYERVAYSPAGTRIALGYPGGIVRLQENGSERELTPFPESYSDISALVFSPDGTRLAISTLSEMLVIWDVEQSEEITRLSGYMPELYSIEFSPDGSVLALGDAEDNLRLWNPVMGSEYALIPHGGGGRIKINPDSTRLAVADHFSIRVWNLDDYTLAHELTMSPLTNLDTTAWSPDGTLLIGAGSTASGEAVPGSPEDMGFIRLWDTATWNIIARPELPGDAASVEFNPAGTQFVYGNSWGDVFLVDVETLQVVHKWLTGLGPAGVSFSPDGERLAVVPEMLECTVQVYVLSEETPSFEFNSCDPVRWSPNGDLLATTDAYGTVLLWDAATGEKLFSSVDYYSNANWLAFSPDGSQLLTSGRDGTVRVWGIG